MTQVQKIRRPLLVTFFAFERLAKSSRSSCVGQDPLTVSQRRIVPDVLIMAAFEFSPPMPFVILAESDYLSLHIWLWLCSAALAPAGRPPPKKDR